MVSPCRPRPIPGPEGWEALEYCGTPLLRALDPLGLARRLLPGAVPVHRGPWSVVARSGRLAVKIYAVAMADNLEQEKLRAVATHRPGLAPEPVSNGSARVMGVRVPLWTVVRWVEGERLDSVIIGWMRRGGDLPRVLQALGAAVRDLHDALASIPPGPASAGAAAWGWIERLRVRAGIVRGACPQCSRAAGALLALYKRYARGAEELAGCRVQHVHGDLHLGQALVSAGRIVLLDFEGEPYRFPPSWRDEPEPVERDLASALRSLDYAAKAAGREEPPQSLVRAVLEGYGSRRGCPEWALEFWLAERASYELVYEIRARTGLEWVPAGFLARLARGTGQPP